MGESNLTKIYNRGMTRDPIIFTLGVTRQPATETPAYTGTLRISPGETKETETGAEEEEEMGKALVVIVVVVAVVAVAYFVLYRNKGRH